MRCVLIPKKYIMVQYSEIHVINKHVTWHSLHADEVFERYLLIKKLCRIGSDLMRLATPYCTKQLLSMHGCFEQRLALLKRFLYVKHLPMEKGIIRKNRNTCSSLKEEFLVPSHWHRWVQSVFPYIGIVL